MLAGHMRVRTHRRYQLVVVPWLCSQPVVVTPVHVGGIVHRRTGGVVYRRIEGVVHRWGGGVVYRRGGGVRPLNYVGFG